MSNEQADQEAAKAAGRASAFFEMRRKEERNLHNNCLELSTNFGC